MMDKPDLNQETEKLLNNSLTSKQILENKGLNCSVWKEYGESIKVLPKMGQKQFEPNNSALQNMQIEKALKTRKEILGVERVERISQLSRAEWLPDQRRARVIKKLGSLWGNFGLEIDCALLLIPEEALLLLEMNYLELTWNGVPLSIQQAYNILIDDSECSLEEYRVFSDLVRCGYRLQRFNYKQIEKNAKSNESKRIINTSSVEEVSLNNSNDSNDNESTGKDEISDEEKNNQIKKNDIIELEPTIGNINDTKNVEMEGSKTESKDITESKYHNSLNNEVSNIDEVIHGVLDDIMNDIDDIVTYSTTDNSDSNHDNQDFNKNRNARVEIVSDETLLGNIKVIKDPMTNSKSSGTRIQRNVKLLSKSTDKPSTSTLFQELSEVAVIDIQNEDSVNRLDKRKISTEDRNTPVKKLKHEIIELSDDDEIEEVPRSLSKTGVSNPVNSRHSTSKEYISTQLVSRRSDSCEKWTSQTDMYHLKNNGNGNFSQHRNTSSNEHNISKNSHFFNQHLNSRTNPNSLPGLHQLQQSQQTNFNSIFNSQYPPVLPHRGFIWQQRHTIIEPKINLNLLDPFSSFTSIIQNRFMPVHVNNRTTMFSSFVRHHALQNLFHQCFIQHFSLQQSHPLQSRIMGNAYSSPRNNKNYWNHNNSSCSNSSNQIRYRGRQSGLEKSQSTEITEENLRKKSQDEKIITIADDEDFTTDVMDCSEVQVVEQLTNPLVNPKNVSNFKEIFNRLGIIKSAPERTVRRKKREYKISYNVYSCQQKNYKKSSPGLPLFRLAVVRKNENTLIQPIELSSLFQDAGGTPIVLACVAMTINYIQPGFISVPNLESC